LVLVLLGDFIGLAPRAMQYTAENPVHPVAALEAGTEGAAGDAAAQQMYAAPEAPAEPTESPGMGGGPAQPTESASGKLAPTSEPTAAPLAQLPPEPTPSPVDVAAIAASSPDGLFIPTISTTLEITAPRTLQVTVTQTISPTATAYLKTSTPTPTPTMQPALPLDTPFSPSPAPAEVSQAQELAVQPTPTYYAPPGARAEGGAAGSPPALRMVEIILGVLAVATGLTAFFLRRGARQ
jgi:hypothetical protein